MQSVSRHFSPFLTVDGTRQAACEPALMDGNLELSTNKPFVLTLLTNAWGVCHTERGLGQEVLTFQTITWLCVDANDCYVFMN